MTTPAIVAWTPDSYTASHSAMPMIASSGVETTLDAMHHGDEHRDRQRHEQQFGFEAVGVEDGDHRDRTDVVDDRKCEQEHLDRARHPAAEQRDDTEGEGDVGRHRDPPPVEHPRRRR